MQRIPRISESEWQVLAILWKKGSLSASQALDQLRDKSWNLSTVRTFLARLEKKGVVESHDRGNAKSYSPLIGREECVREASQSFLDRVFEGATAALLMHFVKSKRLSDRDLAVMREILAKKQKRK